MGFPSFSHWFSIAMAMMIPQAIGTIGTNTHQVATKITRG
jgi:hypothetical protein